MSGKPVADHGPPLRKDELIGRTVGGRFRITRLLGEGGMAKVYAAVQPAEEAASGDGGPREIALKIMDRELAADRSFLHRFQREAEAASKVRHPNSVRIIDYGTSGGLSYIAMELLVGEDLYAVLERNGAIAQSRAARILAEVCDVLSMAHELGIVHRDLKPENVMVVPDADHADGERVKVLDFGIAKLLDVADAPKDARAEPASAITRVGTFIGTPAYMSPEQCALLPVDTRSDIYTCGVLLFQLVTGQQPFQGETPLHTATLHIHQQPPSPRSLAPSLDPRLEALILKALQKKPVDRPQTARSLAAALRHLYADLPEVPATTPLSSAPSPLEAGNAATSRPPSPIPEDEEHPIGSARTMIADVALLAPPSSVVLRAPRVPAITVPPPNDDRSQRPGPISLGYEGVASMPPSSDPVARIRSPESLRSLLGESEAPPADSADFRARFTHQDAATAPFVASPAAASPRSMPPRAPPPRPMPPRPPPPAAGSPPSMPPTRRSPSAASTPALAANLPLTMGSLAPPPRVSTSAPAITIVSPPRPEPPAIAPAPSSAIAVTPSGALAGKNAVIAAAVVLAVILLLAFLAFR